MNRPAEIAEDKLHAILALIECVDERIGPISSFKAKRKFASKRGTTASASRSSD